MLQKWETDNSPFRIRISTYTHTNKPHIHHTHSHHTHTTHIHTPHKHTTTHTNTPRTHTHTPYTHHTHTYTHHTTHTPHTHTLTEYEILNIQKGKVQHGQGSRTGRTRLFRCLTQLTLPHLLLLTKGLSLTQMGYVTVTDVNMKIEKLLHSTLMV